jgi:hypothetical protein
MLVAVAGLAVSLSLVIVIVITGANEPAVSVPPARCILDLREA